MKKIIVAILLLCSCQAFAQKAKYVVLITIDGLRPEFYLDPSWNTPNLQRMMNEGVYAEAVRGVFPSVTYPSHTTIITGCLPARHGIYYNAPFEPVKPTGRWYWESAYIRVPTLWQAAHKAGLQTAAVAWPVTVGADIDHNVPEIWSLAKNPDRADPIRANTTPKGFFEELEKEATGTLRTVDLDGEYLTLDENLSRMGSYIIRRYKPNFMAIHFPCVDEAEHSQGRDGDHVRAAVASADRCVGKVLEALAIAGITDSTAVIVTGDHGFADVHTTLFPNVWLTTHGLIKRTPQNVEWKAKFHASGGSTFLHLNTTDRSIVDTIKNILSALPSDQRKFRIVERTELDKLGTDSSVVLALAPIEGTTFGNAETGEPLRPASQKGTHGYLPDTDHMHTGFIGFGAGFTKHGKLAKIEMESIAPTIAALLGIPFSAEGVPHPGVLAK